MEDNRYIAFLDELPTLEIENEDGDTFGFEMRPGTTEEDIANWESSNGVKIPADMIAFLRRWNGGDFYFLCFEPLRDLGVNAPGMLAFHNWGNGDFDCLRFRENGNADVVFYNHETGATVTIAPSFSNWLMRVIDEMRTIGTLLHPMDYQFGRRDYKGIYSNVEPVTSAPDEKKWWQFWK